MIYIPKEIIKEIIKDFYKGIIQGHNKATILVLRL